jgi:TRAP-type transport system periplasmic protein
MINHFIGEQLLLRAGLACVLVACMAAGGCEPREKTGNVDRLRLGHVYEVKSPTHAFGTAHLNERLAAAGVDLRISVFPAAQLGSEAELLEQLVAGEIDLAIAGPSFLAMWHPPLGAFDAAYAFTDLEQMLEVADGSLMAPHWTELRQRYGVRVLGTWAYGARHITSNRPIRSPEDLKGFRLRMPGARVWQESGVALGASPMPMAFSEVYMALQQGIADGQENPVPVIHSMGFHEVQRYLVMTGHIQSSVQVLINERVWRRLDAQQQDAMTQVVEELGREVLVGIREQERELLDQWRREGPLQIIDDVDLDAFRERARDYFVDGFAFTALYREITRGPEASATQEQR